ncbi:hypothetical protein BGX27_002498 [Mortierella sp. AM989]|nr:hypothetical protein BGX27_002498 [Mortierella sp. AM989]
MFKRLFRLDGASCKKNKRLTIYVESPAQQDYYRSYDVNPYSLVLVRGTREKPGMVQATVTLELDTACEGDEVLQRKRWVLPVTKLGPHVISAGTYSRQVSALIEPSWPSSCMEHPEGFVQYSFHARITKMSVTKATMPLLTTSQEFLVLNLNNSCENYSNYNDYNQCNSVSKFNLHGKENYSNSCVSNISYSSNNKHNYSNSCLSNVSYSNLGRQNFSNSCHNNVSYNHHNKHLLNNTYISNNAYNSLNKHHYGNNGIGNAGYNNHNNHNNYGNSVSSNISYNIRTKHSFFILPNSTVGALPAASTPHTVSVLSPKKSVPMEMSIPSETLVFGQRVPITIVVNPFSEWTPFVGQEIVVMEARFGIEQTRHARSANRIIKDKIIKDFAEINVPSTFDFQIVHPGPEAGGPFAEYHPIAAFSFECDEIPLVFDQTDPRQERNSHLSM